VGAARLRGVSSRRNGGPGVSIRGGGGACFWLGLSFCAQCLSGSSANPNSSRYGAGGGRGERGMELPLLLLPPPLALSPPSGPPPPSGVCVCGEENNGPRGGGGQHVDGGGERVRTLSWWWRCGSDPPCGLATGGEGEGAGALQSLAGAPPRPAAAPSLGCRGSAPQGCVCVKGVRGPRRKGREGGRRSTLGGGW
jgi:hypothetical protein